MVVTYYAAAEVDLDLFDKLAVVPVLFRDKTDGNLTGTDGEISDSCGFREVDVSM